MTRSETGNRPDLALLRDPGRVEVVDVVVGRGAGDRLHQLTELAARLLGTTFAQVSLLRADEQIVVSLHGMELSAEQRRSPAQDSLCAVTAATGQVLAVDDAPAHPWVRDLPPVVTGLVGAYLGVPLADPAGVLLGSLCVFDGAPRAWDERDTVTLEALGEQVTAELVRGSSGDRKEEVRLQLAVTAADLGSYDYDLRTGELVWDDRMLALHAVDRDRLTRGVEAYTAVVHPEDLPRVNEAIAHAIDVVGELVVEYRVVLPDGSSRWIKGRGRVLTDMTGAPARIVGAAYDSSAERSLRDELTRLLETMPAGFVRVDNDWQITYLNGRAESLTGRTRHELVGDGLWELFPEARGTDLEERYREAVSSRRPSVVETFFAPLGAHFEIHLWPDEEGLSIFFQNVDERQGAKDALEQASRRLAFLAAGGGRLSSTLEPAEVLSVLVDLVVPALASSVSLSVVAQVATLLGMPTSSELDRLYPVLLNDTAGRAPEGGRPTVTVPLRAASGHLGELTATGRDDRPLDELLLSDLATRAAVALDNALSFARQSRAASDLQKALLPREAPGVPDVEVATRYLPASTGAFAGGDFFKTVRVGGRLVTVLGDVMGHGTASAARAGQLHSLVAALALEGHTPGALLQRLAGGIDQMMDLELATLLVCSYDPATRLLTTASAGHPPPLFAPPSGPPHYLDLEPGPPVGVAVGTYPEHTCDLQAGSTTVMYSDGLVEQRGESISVGLERLRAAVEELRLPPEAVADHILESLGRTGGGDDDIALLVFSHL